MCAASNRRNAFSRVCVEARENHGLVLCSDRRAFACGPRQVSETRLASRQRLSSFTLCTPFLVLKHSISLVFVLRMSITGVRRPPCDRHRTGAACPALRPDRPLQHLPLRTFRLPGSPSNTAAPRGALWHAMRGTAHRFRTRARVLSWPFRFNVCYALEAVRPTDPGSRALVPDSFRRHQGRVLACTGWWTHVGQCGAPAAEVGRRQRVSHRDLQCLKRGGIATPA